MISIAINKFKCVVLTLLIAAFSCSLLAQDSGFVVLDTKSSWRMFSVIKPPVIRETSGVKPVSIKIKWLDTDTQPAPANWAALDLDDSGWLRGPATLSPNTAMLSKLYLRGKFNITNLNGVTSLTLDADYHGGIVVYLNGEEVGRANVSKDSKGNSEFADDYPEEAFVTENNFYLAPQGAYIDAKAGFKPSAESVRRMGLWKRTAKLKIPVKNVKKGVNVLGIEVFRSVYDKAFNKVQMKRVNGFPHDFTWATCHVLNLKLITPGSSGVVSSSVRPEGLQIWNADLLQGDFDIDFNNPAEPLKPVKIVGPRNGLLSGKVHVGSTNPIEGISAAASDLKGQKSSIPVTAIKIRYGVPWGGESIVDGTYHKIRYPFAVGTTFMGGLSNKPLEEYPLGKQNGDSPAGAVAPVWISVKVPKDAAPGIYSGTLTVKTKGKNVTAPIELKVLPWALPDPQDYKTWVGLVESPDTLTVEYEIPLWSDKHFAMKSQ